MAIKNTQASLIEDDDDTVFDAAPNRDTSPNAGAMPDDRKSREQEARANLALHEAYSDQWDKPLNFSNELTPRPGFVQRLVRVPRENSTNDDFTNFHKKLNAGWRPRPASTVPEGFFASSNQLTVGKRDFGDVVMSYDLVLMERPESIHQQAIAKRQAYQDSLQTMVNENISSDIVRNTKGLRNPNQTNRHNVSFATPDND
jgi:hypothetical protein